MAQAALDTEDLATLASLAQDPAGLDDVRPRADRTWSRAQRLLQEAGEIVSTDALELDIWPWCVGNVRFPFVWARYKRPAAAEFAAHLGVFLAPDGCNCGLDLEKDLLDAGESRETLDDYLRFFGATGRESLAGLDDASARVWTDDANVEALGAFLATDFATFMHGCGDADHPWPRVGYRFDPHELIAESGSQVEFLAGKLARLLPIYDSLLGSYGRAS